MIEVTILNYLKNALDVPVETEVPKNPPQKYITFEKIDSGRTNYIDAATIEFMCYGKSKFEAAQLSEQLKNAMFDIVYDENACVSSCTLGGESDNTDTANKKYRYRCIFNLFY